MVKDADFPNANIPSDQPVEKGEQKTPTFETSSRKDDHGTIIRYSDPFK